MQYECSNCKRGIEGGVCHQCQNLGSDKAPIDKFYGEKNDEVFCFGDGEYHFHSKECAMDWLDEWGQSGKIEALAENQIGKEGE